MCVYLYDIECSAECAAMILLGNTGCVYLYDKECGAVCIIMMMQCDACVIMIVMCYVISIYVVPYLHLCHVVC